MADVEILADFNYNSDCNCMYCIAIITWEIKTVASPISNTTSNNIASTPVTQGKANGAGSSDAGEKQTEDGVSETQATGDRVSLSQTSVQLSAEPTEGSIQSPDEAAQVASNLKGLISGNPAQAIASQSGS